MKKQKNKQQIIDVISEESQSSYVEGKSYRSDVSGEFESANASPQGLVDHYENDPRIIQQQLDQCKTDVKDKIKKVKVDLLHNTEKKDRKNQEFKDDMDFDRLRQARQISKGNSLQVLSQENQFQFKSKSKKDGSAPSSNKRNTNEEIQDMNYILDGEDSPDENDNQVTDSPRTQAKEVFGAIFERVFQEAEDNNQEYKGNIYITKRQYEDAIKEWFNNDEDEGQNKEHDESMIQESIQHFMQLYDLASKSDDQIQRDNLVDAIYNDMKIQMQSDQLNESVRDESPMKKLSQSLVSKHSRKNTYQGRSSLLTGSRIRKMTLHDQCKDQLFNSSPDKKDFKNPLQTFKRSSEVLQNNKSEHNSIYEDLASRTLGGGTIDVNFSNDTNKLEFDDSAAGQPQTEIYEEMPIQKYLLHIKNGGPLPKQSNNGLQKLSFSYHDLKRTSRKSIQNIRHISRTKSRLNTSKNNYNTQDSQIKESEESPFESKDEIIDENEIEDQLIEEQSKQIFELIFAQIFRFNSRSGLHAITMTQFEEAIQDHSWNSFQTGVEQNQLLSLFRKADINKTDEITKQQVLDLIKNDLRFGDDTDLNNDHIFKKSDKNDGEIYGDSINSGNPVVLGEIDDPTLNQLANRFKNDTSNGQQKCQDLVQAIEYMTQSKLGDFTNSEEKLKFLLGLITNTVTKIQQDYEKVNNQAKDKFQYEDVNQEMEAALEQLSCENSELKIYEKSFFEQKQKHEQSLEQNYKLEIENQNLLTVNQDLLNLHADLKQENKKKDNQIDEDKLKLKLLEDQVQQLQHQIINNYDGKNEDDFQKEIRDQLEDDQPDQMEKIANFYPEQENKTDEDSSDQPQIVDMMSSNGGSISDQSESNCQSNSVESKINQVKKLSFKKKAMNNVALQQPKNEILQKPILDLGSSSDSDDNQASHYQSKTLKLEQEIIDTLETTGVYNMREDIQKYITNHVQLERKGLNQKISNLKKNQKELKKLMLRQKMKIQELKNVVAQKNSVIEIRDKDIYHCQEEFRQLRAEYLGAAEEANRLNQEKNRLRGVNDILEQRIHVEKSEKMTVLSEAEHISRFAMGQSMRNATIISKMSQKFGAGQMSTYIRQQNNTIVSMNKSNLKFNDKLSRRSLNMSMQQRLRNNTQDFKGMDDQSVGSRQNLWIKDQTRKRGDENSEYRGKNTGFSQADGSSYFNGSKAQVINDDQSDFSSQVHRVGGAMSFKSSVRSRRTNIMMNRSMISGRDSQGIRQQLIDDCSSYGDESIENLGMSDLKDINDDLQNFQDEELKKRRLKNVYDQISICEPKHFQQDMVRQIIQAHLKQTPEFTFEGVQEQQIYSENFKVYYNRKLYEAMIIINEGIVYIIQKEKLLIQPFNFLSDILKVRYSEKHENYIAIKLKDMRKFQNRDHVIIEIKDRKLLADFMLDYAQKQDDEIIWEHNEEFNMIVLSSPVWFSFDDVDKCKKEAQHLFKSQNFSISGYLEVKQSNMMVKLFKSIINLKDAGWETKYIVVKGTKCYIYPAKSQTDSSGQLQNQFTKPEKLINLTESMEIKELRKHDIGGKQFAFTIEQANNSGPSDVTVIAAASSSQMETWITMFKDIKQEIQKQYRIQKQKEIDELRDMKNINQIQLDSFISKDDGKDEDINFSYDMMLGDGVTPQAIKALQIQAVKARGIAEESKGKEVPIVKVQLCNEEDSFESFTEMKEMDQVQRAQSGPTSLCIQVPGKAQKTPNGMAFKNDSFVYRGRENRENFSCSVVSSSSKRSFSQNMNKKQRKSLHKKRDEVKEPNTPHQESRGDLESPVKKFNFENTHQEHDSSNDYSQGSYQF